LVGRGTCGHSRRRPPYGIILALPGGWELVVTELTPERAREECRKRILIATLELIPAEDRIKAFAAAMQELEGKKQRRSVERRAAN